MNNQNKTSAKSRRLFLTRSVPFCAFTCLGLSRLSTTVNATECNLELFPAQKFKKKVGWTYEQAYRWRARLYSDRMNRIANYLGRDKVIDALKKSTEDYYNSIATYKPENTLQNFIKPFFKDDYNTILTIEVIENREDLVSWRITECLNAKIFRELNMSDIGYATLCHGDEAWAKAYNPRIQFTRTKTLMDGDDCCNHCYKTEK